MSTHLFPIFNYEFNGAPGGFLEFPETPCDPVEKAVEYESDDSMEFLEPCSSVTPLDGKVEKGVRVVRPKGWNKTLAVTRYPLTSTLVLYKGRLSLGFEVVVEEEETNWAGTLEVGFTFCVDKKAEMRARFRPYTVTCTTDTMNVLGEDAQNSKHECDYPAGVGAVKTGSTSAVMIHLDEDPPRFLVYRNGEACGSGVPLPDLLERMDVQRLEETAPHQLTASCTIPADLFGCVELYGKCKAVRMIYDNITPAMGMEAYHPRMFAHHPRELKEAIRTIFRLQQTVESFGSLPVEVMLVICGMLAAQRW